MSKGRPVRSAIFAGMLLVGCGSPGSSWQDALAQVDLGQSAFSLAYVAPPPDGTFLTIAAHANQASAATCSVYESQQAPADFWYLGIDTTATSVGSYTVVDRISPPSAVPSATVKLVHVRSGNKIETIGAVTGDVAIIAAPQSADQWHTDTFLQGTVRVDFPKEAWRERECAGGQGAGQSEPTVTSCNCVGPGGQMATCVPSTPTENCCALLGVAAGTAEYSSTITAAPCGWMCKFTDPSLARECLALQ